MNTEKLCDILSDVWNHKKTVFNSIHLILKSIDIDELAEYQKASMSIPGENSCAHCGKQIGASNEFWWNDKPYCSCTCAQADTKKDA